MNRGSFALGVIFSLTSVVLAFRNAFDAGPMPTAFAAFGALMIAVLLANVIVSFMGNVDRLAILICWFFILVGALFVAGPASVDGYIRSHVALAVGCAAIGGVVMGCSIAKAREKATHEKQKTQ